MTRLSKIRSLIHEEVADISQAIRDRRHPALIQNQIVSLAAAINEPGPVEPIEEKHPALAKYEAAYLKCKEATNGRR